MVNISSGEFDRLCRICMQQLTINNGKNLFNTNYQTFTLVELLDMCTTSTASEDDELPANMCSECTAKLIEFYEFLMISSTSEETFRQILSDEALSRSNDIIKVKDEPEISIDEVEMCVDGIFDQENELVVKIEQENPFLQNDILPEKSPKRKRKSGKSGKPRDYQCFDCKHNFKRRKNLLKHFSVHDRTVVIKVEERIPIFVDPSNIDNIKPRKPIIRAYKCDYCPIVLSSPQWISKHVKKHENKILYKCSKCKYKYYIKAQFEDHFQETHIYKHFCCGVCNKAYGHLYALRYHMRRHTKEKPYQCIACGIAFSAKKYLSNHLLQPCETSQIKKKKRVYQCFDCKRMFTNKTRLVKHYSTHAPTEKVLEECSPILVEPSMVENVRMKSTKKNKIYQCDYCSGVYTAKYTRKHALTHENRILYQCTRCPNKYYIKAQFEDHWQNRHINRKKNYCCSICNKGFHSPSAMKVHMRTHTGEKPHLCITCGKTFNSIAISNRHMPCHRLKIEKSLEKYKGTQEHVCEICLKRFASKQSLNSHSLIHTGEKKTFKCEYCDHQTFGRMEVLIKHMKKHHTANANNIYKCTRDNCSKAFRYHRDFKQHLAEHFRHEHPIKNLADQTTN